MKPTKENNMSLGFKITLPVLSLGVYAKRPAQTTPNNGAILPQGFDVARFAWVDGDSYTNAYDAWVAAGAAAKVLGGEVYLAINSGGVWYAAEASDLEA
jgi:hypothetical protein